MKAFKQNKIFLILMLVFSISYSCKDSQQKTITPDQASTEDPKIFNETGFNIISHAESPNTYLKIHINDLSFHLKFVEDNAYLQYLVRKQPINKWQQVIYNFTYNTDFENAKKNIKILMNNTEGFLLLPGYTEQYPTYSVYKFTNNSFSYYKTIVLETDETLGNFKIAAIKEKDITFYAQKSSGKKIKFSYTEPYPIPDKNLSGDMNLKNESYDNTIIEKPIKNITADLNGDGVNDVLTVFKNNFGATDFEQSHFSLPIEISLSLNNRNNKIFRNENLVFSSQSNCTSEGFSDMVVKNNYFTIESQTCYDYSILVSSFTTFKIVGGEIFLHKYGETYFDKSNHEKIIPPLIKTENDFGKVPFEKVTESLLLSLRDR